MSTINKLEVGNTTYDIGGVVVSLGEPQGDNRVPLWIVPETAITEGTYINQTSGSFSTSISGTTKYVGYCLGFDTETYLPKYYCTKATYSNSTDATKAAKVLAGYGENDTNIPMIYCVTYTNTTVDSGTENCRYELTNVKPFHIKPNTQYATIGKGMYGSVTVGLVLKLVCYDHNMDYLGTVSHTVTQSDIDTMTAQNIDYILFDDVTPVGTVFGYVQNNVANMMMANNFYYLKEAIAGQNWSTGIYSLSTDNDEYYKIY